MKLTQMIYRRAVLALLLTAPLLAASSVSAQDVDNTKTITTGVPFLLISPDSRAGGMGEANVAIADDASAIFWNPAGLGFQRGFNGNFTYANWLPAFNAGLSYNNLMLKNYFPGYGTFGLGLVFLNLGSSIRTNAAGDELGEFRSYEYALTLSYGVRLLPVLSVGASIRYINSALSPVGAGDEQGSGNGQSVAFDLATLWKPKFQGYLGERLSVGLNISNIGPKISYIDQFQADPLPTNFKLGVAFKPVIDRFNNLTIALDFNKLLVRKREVITDDSTSTFTTDNVESAIFTSWTDGGLRTFTVGVGAEYWYGDPQLLALRAGYFYEDPQYGGRRYLTFGAGLRYTLFGVDFSYISTVEEDHPLAGTVRLSLSLNLDAGSKKTAAPPPARQ
ncbi:MAG: type IX secretion system outer membrane channel protein PorV [Rhizobacter sp.]|nr:type IX secretion system outer membrane channel protein PorV [Chlorobiales bacterium]